MDLNQDFKEFIESLNANQVKHLVVGGYAVAFHGHPRYTKDLDFWIWAEPQNAERLLLALRDFGFSSLDLTTATSSNRTISSSLAIRPIESTC